MLTGLLLLWQVATSVFGPSAFILPDPIAIGRALIENPGMYLVNTYYTAANTLMGFGLSVLIGCGLALGIIYSRFLDASAMSSCRHKGAFDTPRVFAAILLLSLLGTLLFNMIVLIERRVIPWHVPQRAPH